MNAPVELELDGETCALIVSLCSKLGQTPDALLGSVIRDEAEKRGLAKPQEQAAKSA